MDDKILAYAVQITGKKANIMGNMYDLHYRKYINLLIKDAMHSLSILIEFKDGTKERGKG